MLFSIWFVKFHSKTMRQQQINEQFGFILLEIIFFFVWVLSGIIFLLFAYTSKMSTFMRNTYEIENDDNPWNNKDTEDFLRHLKREYFTMVYSIAYLAMEITCGFTDLWEIEAFGPRDLSVSGFILITAMIPRVVELSALVVFSLKGYDATSPQMHCMHTTLVVVDLVALVVLITF